jgi:hypothetical protein
MKYMMIWTDAAVGKLTQAWIDSSDRNRLTSAVHEIELELAEDPEAIGRRTFDNVREYRYPPIGVEFEVVEADRIVYVLSVWLTG